MQAEPRPYQASAVASVQAQWAAGKRAVCLVAGTGAGKTVMGAALLARAVSPLVVVHTRVLLAQTARRIPGAIVTTIQALLADGAAGDRRRARLSSYDIVMLDECHHTASEEWRALLPLLAHAKVFGCTATPQRADGTPLGDVFDSLVVAAQYSELLAGGHLCPCDVARSELRRADQKRQKVRPDGVAAYLEHGKRADGSWRPAIYFDSTIALCADAIAGLQRKGLRAALVCCDTKEDERQKLFDAYNAGELDVLASPMALSEGFDAPRAEVCVLRRSCEHVGTYLQIVGRVLRPHPDKQRALLIDITGASSLHGLPTDDRVYSLDGSGMARVPLPEPEEPEEEKLKREQHQIVATRYELIRDSLRDRFRELQAQQQEHGRKAGWVWYRFREQTGLDAPRVFEAKYASVCKHCRHRVVVGGELYWVGAGQAYHPDCWFSSLDEQRLDRAQAQQRLQKEGT